MARNSRKKTKREKSKDRIATFPVEYVMPFIIDVPGRYGKLHKVNFNSVQVNMASDRMRCFLHSGTKCVCCGMDADFFALERFCEEEEYVLNLYGHTEEGREILFTKDHIVPRSKGGPSAMDNYQTMCASCNHAKGSSIETPVLQRCDGFFIDEEGLDLIPGDI